MKDMKREVLVFVQYLGLLLLAFPVTFLWLLSREVGGDNSGGEFAVTINITEAWRNISGLLWGVFLVFSALGVIRLSLLFLAARLKGKTFE